MNHPEDKGSASNPSVNPNPAYNAAANRAPGNGTGIWSLLAPLWAVWVILFFIATMPLVFPTSLAFSHFRPDPQKTRAFAAMARVWMGVFLPLAGTPLTVRGREKFAPGQTYIVVCNHN